MDFIVDQIKEPWENTSHKREKSTFPKNSKDQKKKFPKSSGKKSKR
jgi:hypothetical protein